MDIRTADTIEALSALIARMSASEARPSEYTEGAVDIDLLVDGEVVTQVTLTPALTTWGDSPDCWLRGDAIQAIREATSDLDGEEEYDARRTLYTAIVAAARGES